MALPSERLTEERIEGVNSEGAAAPGRVAQVFGHGGLAFQDVSSVTRAG